MSATQKTSLAFQLGRLSLINELLEACITDEEMPSAFLRDLEDYRMKINNTIIKEYPEQHVESIN